MQKICFKFSFFFGGRGGGGDINGCIKQGRSEIRQFGTHKNFLHLNKKNCKLGLPNPNNLLTKDY